MKKRNSNTHMDPRKFELKSKFQIFLKKFWDIVWRDDSLKGWLISLIFLFIVIKGIFFPLMSLATGTSLPLVIVESCSMYHDNNLLSDTNEWWTIHENKYSTYQITKDQFLDFPFKKGFNKGDILFITGAKASELEMGDIIIFNANYRNPVIHRIISIQREENEYIFGTIGDNNNGQIEFEKRIGEHQVVGKAQINIAPYIGWGKLIFFERLRNPQERGFCNEN